ncbi:MAG: hypothetical protein U9Q99_00500 [Nanoarchaeota archaeon]|nr:hypothetical protein [Nanoarchaeota archaeon]
MKESEAFKKEENKVKELESKKQELGKVLNNLKQAINFKELLKFYHKFENEMKLVKEYKENFQQTIQNSKSEVLLSLLKEAKLETNEITELAQKLNYTKQEIKEIQIKDMGLSALEREFHRINSEIDSNKLEESANKKKLKHIKESLEDVLKKIKYQFKEIDIEFE